MSEMSDLELTRLCAEAMELSVVEQLGALRFPNTQLEHSLYDPLHDDAQAMALVKRLHLSVGYNGGWGAVKIDERGMLLSGAYHYDALNRAIVECVATLQSSKDSK